MKYLIIVSMLLLPASGLASTTLDGWLDMQTGGDSLAISPGRMDIGGMLGGDGWTLLLRERFSRRDSTGITPRVLGTHSITDVDFIIAAGPVTINPEVSWVVDLGDKPEIVLPLAAGEAYRQGYIRPGLSLSGDLNENIHLFASGLYWNRDLKQEDDYDLDWAESRISGGAAWDTPWGPTIAVSGVSHRTESDFIDYEASWSRIDFTAAAGRNDMPLGLQAQAEVTYSLYGGNDFLDREIADRFTARIRLARMVIPNFSVNTIFESVFDFDDGTVRTACNSGEARIMYRFLQSRDVPSQITLSGQLAVSSIRTSKLQLSSRVNLYRGLSLLLGAMLRETPTDVQKAGPDRQRLVFGPGLEYQLGTNARIWGMIEQERTNLEEVEVWWRLRAGLELYPGTLTF